MIVSIIDANNIGAVKLRLLSFTTGAIAGMSLVLAILVPSSDKIIMADTKHCSVKA